MSSERENSIGCQEVKQKLLLNVNKGLSTSSLALINHKNSLAAVNTNSLHNKKKTKKNPTKKKKKKKKKKM